MIPTIFSETPLTAGSLFQGITAQQLMESRKKL